MPVVEVNNIFKSYAGNRAVSDLSFTIEKGEIVGLIGPNGAGKSTSIKIILNFIKPDSGSIRIFSREFTEKDKNLIGYLPEERGLYLKQKVFDLIIYFATLKGMTEKEARVKAGELLHLTAMYEHRNKTIEEMSKGMGQVVQFIITIIHQPELIIMDEPFSGLDPVNAAMLKKIVIDLKNEGKSIILSTHQMNEVEALCDRILMIHNGKAVLYGNLIDIRSKYRSNSVYVKVDGEIGNIRGVIKQVPQKDCQELILDQDAVPQQILEKLVQDGKKVSRFEIAEPSLNEIFIKVVKSDE